MRILILSAAFRPHPGGVATHVTELAHGIRRHRVFVLTSRRGSPETKEEPNRRLTVWKWGEKLVREFDGRRVHLERLFEFLSARWPGIKCDIVHAHDFDSLQLGAMLKTAFGVKLVATVHDAPRSYRRDLEQERAKACILSELGKAGYIDHIVVPSRASARALQGQGLGTQMPGSPPITVIPHGINGYLRSQSDKPELLQDIGLEAATRLVLCPTRIDVHKDVNTVVEATARLKREGGVPNFVTVVTTPPEGTEYEVVRRVAEQRGLNVGADIVFRDYEHFDMATLYRRATVCVVASPRESFGISVLEAFLFQKPVVAANAGALSEIIEHKRTGLHFEVMDDEDLARQIRRVLINPAYGARLGTSAAREVAKGGRFSASAMHDGYRRFYEEVLAGADA